MAAAGDIQLRLQALQIRIMVNITIENCRNEASVSGSRGVAGVVSYMSASSNTLTIRNCANTGTITGSGVQTAWHRRQPGRNICDREAAITAGSVVRLSISYAGILGRGVGAAVKNSYTSGSIITYEGSTNVGYAIIGSSKSGGNCTVENSYALEGSGDALNYATGVTADAASAYKSPVRHAGPKPSLRFLAVHSSTTRARIRP